MKKINFLLLTIPLFVCKINFAQVGIGTVTPHPSSRLEITSTNSGLLIPRMNSVQRNAITAPATGLQVFDNDTKSFWFWNGTGWSQLSVGSNGWNLTGNAGINAATNFIGTTDAQALRFRVNNTWAGEIHPTSFNVFIGLGAGQSNTDGQANTAIGEHSLFANTDGNFNSAHGYYSLAANTSGFNNTALGANALTSNLQGTNNTAVGRNALFANTSGSSNTATGADALLTNTTGVRNTATGYKALYGNTTGFDNTAMGESTLSSNTSGIHNTAYGASALSQNTTGSNNTATGVSALSTNKTGYSNTANGFQALASNSTGQENTASGCAALFSNSTGFSNTANGFRALLLNTTGNSNTANGYKALYNNFDGGQNTASGFQALFSNTSGSGNVGNGVYALNSNTSGGSNTAIGGFALNSNTIGSGNTSIGQASQNANISGNSNTAAGGGALFSNTSGSGNTAIGSDALFDITSGSNNIAIGINSGTGGPNKGILTNTIGIGNTMGFLNGASNQAIIGNASTVFIGGKVNWGVVSDQRIKSHIQEDVKGLDFILRLRPVTYNISNNAISEITRMKDTISFAGKYDGEKITYTGFLAQEVEKAAIASGYDFSGYTKPKTDAELYTIRYAEFVVPLVKAMQEQQKMIGGQQTTIEELRDQVTEMKREIELLKKNN